jgi:hypothetical protein
MSAKKMSQMTTGKKVALGAGLMALAAAGVAGAYFLYAKKDAAKNRKQVKAWVLKAKADVLGALEKAQVVTEENYHMIVDAALDKYAKAKDVAPEELAMLNKELKSHWKSIKSHLAPKVKKAKTVLKKKRG